MRTQRNISQTKDAKKAEYKAYKNPYKLETKELGKDIYRLPEMRELKRRGLENIVF